MFITNKDLIKNGTHFECFRCYRCFKNKHRHFNLGDTNHQEPLCDKCYTFQGSFRNLCKEEKQVKRHKNYHWAFLLSKYTKQGLSSDEAKHRLNTLKRASYHYIPKVKPTFKESFKTLTQKHD